ncbi:MAG: TusE/DsrC/DsvC family sulfur relay protein [Syntrophobacteraceae bacterium]
METLKSNDKIYLLDNDGFLVNSGQWDEDFAQAMAPAVGITDGLTPSHWDVLRFIRATYLETGSCPIVHKTCKAHKLSFKDLQRLFPSGYQRGACKLAGLSFIGEGVSTPIGSIPIDKRVYRVNVQGFLIDLNEWDKEYAIFKARELQMAGPLGEKHWQIISYMRSEYEEKDEVPTVYATCEACGIDIDTLAELFPSGYHRGAAKIAGLNLAAKRHRGARDPGI